MRTVNKPSIFLIAFSLFYSCINQSHKDDYYIISEKTFYGKNLNDSNPPPPPMPSPIKWYTNLVIIIDSTDLIHIYQTELKAAVEVQYIKPGESPVPFDKGLEIEDTLIYEYNYPNFIDLKPEFLITLSSSDFIPFISLNNDIFRFDPSKIDNPKMFYIASSKDTIKNFVFYDLLKMIKPFDQSAPDIHAFIRKTTEEENAVIKHKRGQVSYYPDKLEWSNQFIDGESTPFTSKYRALENKIGYLRKAKESIDTNSTEIKVIK